MKYIFILIISWLQLLNEGCCTIQTVLATDSEWYLPRIIKAYGSYLDISPVRYDLPKGHSRVAWTFKTMHVAGDCGDKKIYIHLQQNGLPLIVQNNLTFPENFIVTPKSTITFIMKPNQMVTLSLVRPPGGSWYAIAYTIGVDHNIRQKGLSSSERCFLSYISHFNMGESIQKEEIDTGKVYTSDVDSSGKIISFTVSPSTFAFEVIITDCVPANCSVFIKYKPFKIQNTVTTSCTDIAAEPCKLHVPSPPFQDEQLILFYSDNITSMEISYYVRPLTCETDSDLLGESMCMSLPLLSRLNSPEPFQSIFGYMLPDSSMSISVTSNIYRTVVLPFTIKEPNDVGSTLKWGITDGNIGEKLNEDIYFQLCGDIIYDHLPDMTDGNFDICVGNNNYITFVISSETETSDDIQRYVPYPRTGNWHLVLQASCYFLSNNSKTVCPADSYVSMSLILQPCMDYECNGKGQCDTDITGSDLVGVSSCKCSAGYKGYACTDDSDALSGATQIVGALLLTLSNLFFIPSIIIAIRRKFFIEALVYFYTMFFSTFYHACDGDRIDEYKRCIMSFDVLQSCDFFGSSCSLWFTLVAMARIRIYWMAPLLQIIGPLGLIIGVIYDKTSLYVIAIPTLCGLFFIICSWGYKMYKRKQLYPSLKRYLIFLLPGVCLAATGASVFAFLETEENYKYLHSLWHMTIALSICLLLPPKNTRWADENPKEAEVSTFSLNAVLEGSDDPQDTS